MLQLMLRMATEVARAGFVAAALVASFSAINSSVAYAQTGLKSDCVSCTGVAPTCGVACTPAPTGGTCASCSLTAGGGCGC